MINILPIIAIDFAIIIAATASISAITITYFSFVNAIADLI